MLLQRKSWLAEMAFDFNTVFQVIPKLDNLNEEQKTLKLALFSELSGRDSTAFHRKYIQLIESKDVPRARAVALNIIKKSSNPLKELIRYKKLFQEEKPFYAQLYFESMSNLDKGDFIRQIKIVRKDNFLEQSPLVRFLWRRDFFEEHFKLEKAVSAHQAKCPYTEKVSFHIEASYCSFRSY